MKETIKAKAKEIIESYKKELGILPDVRWRGKLDIAVKQSALLHVNGIIEQWQYIDAYLANLGGELNPNLKFWIKVKESIEQTKI